MGFKTHAAPLTGAVVKISFSFQLERDEFSLDVAAELDQHITGLFGPSGAGKTTLLHLLAGIERPARGRLRIGGRALYDSQERLHIPPSRRNLGVVFQESRLFPHLSVRRNLRYGECRVPAARRRMHFAEVVELLELGGLLEKRPWQISGGEAQRVALGRALLCSPAMLLLDEPLASLDRGLKRQILPFLRRIKQTLRVPMIYVSHDLGEIMQLTDRLMVMESGRLLGVGNFWDLIQRQQILDLIQDLGMLNVVPLRIVEQRRERGITRFLPEVRLEDGAAAAVEWLGPWVSGEVGRLVYTMLRPEDIALVMEPVAGTSIQNQIRVTIKALMRSRHKTVCLIEAGVRLLAEVTPHSEHELGLREGRSLVCLFKAQALSYLE